jgi:UDP-glucuronate decarboxylase
MSRTLDKDGVEITSVGLDRFGFDSRVALDDLRSLYLRPHYITTTHDREPTFADEEKEHAKFTKNSSVYQSKSIYHPDTNSISYTTLSRFAPVKLVPPSQRKRILVTGGAGFVGSHLVDRLMLLGHEITVIDNFFTGSKTSLSHWVGHPNFELVRHDVVEPFMIECDRELSYSLRQSEPIPDYRNLSLGMPCIPTPLPVQRRQDHQNFFHGDTQHAGARQAYQGAIPHHEHLRSVCRPSTSPCAHLG